MARYAFITLFSTLGLFFPGVGMAEGLPLKTVEVLSRGALPEVREFIIRTLGCAYWEDEDRRPRLKAAEVKRALKHLKCSDLKEDEAFLRETYAGHPASINALDAVRKPQLSASDTTTLPPSASKAGF